MSVIKNNLRVNINPDMVVNGKYLFLTHSLIEAHSNIDSQNVCDYSVLLSPIKGLGVEHYVGTVARFGAGNIALPT